MPLPLLEVFPDEDYRFHLTLRAGDVAGFFAPASPEILGERAHWLNLAPDRYVAATPGAESLLNEFEALAAKWTEVRPASETTPLARLCRLGAAIEPDFLLLASDSQGAFRLHAGVVCFPSSWALEDKIGRTLDEIHGPVPTLNATLSTPINRFLSRLKPGSAFERANWGLAPTPELNLHPTLHRPRLGGAVAPENVWVRIEDQLLAALPRGAGVLFGIRLRLIPLPMILADSALHARFFRALRTMPDDVATYKGLAAVRAALLKPGDSPSVL